MSDSDPLSEMNFCFVLRNVKGSYIIQLFVPSVTWRRSKSFFSIYQQTSKGLCVRLTEYVKTVVALEKAIIIRVRETQRDRLKDSERERRKYISVLETVREFIYVMPGSSWFMLVQSSFLIYLSDETRWPSIPTSHVGASKTKKPVYKYTCCDTPWWRVVVFHCCVIQTHLVVPSETLSSGTVLSAKKHVALPECGPYCLTLNHISHLGHIKSNQTWTWKTAGWHSVQIQSHFWPNSSIPPSMAQAKNRSQCSCWV